MSRGRQPLTTPQPPGAMIQDGFMGYVRQHQRPFEVYDIDGNGQLGPVRVVSSDVVETTMIVEADLAAQVSRVSGEITHWGVVEARCRKAWQRGELEYRVWREGFAQKLRQPPQDPDEAKGWKKPSEAQIEGEYRTAPDYVRWQRLLQDLEEGVNSVHAVVEGFRAKRDMLRASVRRAVEDSAPTLSV